MEQHDACALVVQEVFDSGKKHAKETRQIGSGQQQPSTRWPMRRACWSMLAMATVISHMAYRSRRAS
jgi:hypothetical protein